MNRTTTARHHRDAALVASLGAVVAGAGRWRLGLPLPWSAALIIAGLILQRALVTDLERHNERFERDPITRLPNRVGAAIEFERLQASGQGVTLVVVAINGFTEVKDALGATAGDQLLVEVAERLDTANVGLAARTGTNEFTILRHGTDRDDAALGTTRLLDLAHVGPFRAGDAAVVLDWSAGIAFAESTTTIGFEQLLGVADHARERAVARHAGFEIHRPERDDIGRGRLAMLADLRTALDNDQLCVRYQPKARASDGRIVGVEALVRWDHPVHGIVGPDAFLPLLQHSGLSRALTVAVLRQAVAQVAAWRASGYDLTLAVNVTPRDLQDPGFPDAVASALASRRGAANWIQLEVTETSVISDDARTIETLAALARLGVKLAIDDFGAGATSLAWLRDLPVNEVKLDKNYVLKMGGSYVDSAIVRAVIDLAHKLRLTVVAEGVEDAMTWRELEHMGCDLIQGYHLCPPLAGPDLTAWLDRTSTPAVTGAS